MGTCTCNCRGQIAPGSDFALLDAATYRDYDGNQGAYRFDTAIRRRKQAGAVPPENSVKIG